MPTINLLPWREELRQQNKQDFITAIGASVFVTLILFGLVYWHIEDMKEYQQRRNSMLDEQIRLVNKKIKEIKDIEEKKNKLLSKIEAIQTLQESRPRIVHLFDELPKSTPEGIVLSKFKQTGETLVFRGKAQSNASVSAYMRGIEASPWLETPVLKVIKGQGKLTNGSLNDFSLMAKQSKMSLKKSQDSGLKTKDSGLK
ncbi:MAG: pilus assembly protein PilN [Methylococcales symbiont of Iophon sp. n. MRB-2018]|nr:MAG: pilus assembly protein PilN [Methylococcales symbiont of Iophon sp. n. MRB-2018]KAF3980004.1 MAG: pilus assembly protein PilN [Methylococcales symbiont of Iophon sp. n. MRB-2018]